jgi:DNA primase
MSAAPQVYSDRLTLYRQGRYFVACCPFHGERTPSFTVYPDQHFHCFGCGAHGGAAQFLHRTSGLTYAEARKQIGDAPVAAPRRGRGTASYARRLVEEAVPITGTLAETYLRETRGLGDRPLPPETRFHPAVWSRETGSKHPALIIPCRHPDGTVARAQAVLLDPKTGSKANLKAPKLTFGQWAAHVPASFAARVADAPFQALAEGPEKAIAVHAFLGWQADPACQRPLCISRTTPQAPALWSSATMARPVTVTPKRPLASIVRAAPRSWSSIRLGTSKTSTNGCWQWAPGRSRWG